MASGSSGRIVIDVDPALKKQVYDVLTAQGSTMKGWFLTQAEQLCDEHHQPTLQLVAETPAVYSTSKPRK